jgi:thiol-disulfide isomerase/thioredoxin
MLLMKKLFLLPVFLFLIFLVKAEKTFKVKGCIKNLPVNTVYLESYRGSGHKVIDTAMVTNGCFDFYLADTAHAGIYSILLNPNREAYVRILFNSENIEFHSRNDQLLDSMTFTSSAENQLYYEYSKLVTKTTRRIELLNKLLPLYSREEKAYTVFEKEIHQLNSSTEEDVNEMLKDNPNTLFTHMIGAQMPAHPPADSRPTDKVEYMRRHFFDRFDFSYDPLIFTDVIPSILRNYLALYERKDFTQTEQELSYLTAINDVLEMSKGNPEMYGFIIQELLTIFRFGDYDIMGAYITENYMLGDKCPGVVQAQDQKTKIEKIRRVSIGKSAPEIILTDILGKEFRMTWLPNEYVLVVFWATTCSHCTKMLPDLAKIYKQCNDSSFAIVACDLDMDRKRWSDFLAGGTYPWVNLNDPKGWQGKAPDDYNVTATPMFFLLNRERKIIAKPVDIRTVTEKLKAFKILN